MPKMQSSMAHSNRSVPYPSFAEVPSSRHYPQEFSTSTSNERASTAWTSDDDHRLMQLRTQGLNWGPIATHFSGKTPNACRKRHERLMEKKNAESWDDGIKIEDLSRAYLEVREQMWKILADILGEKWTTVETKCMEKGLKTLTTAGRAARRHDLAKQTTPPISQRSGSEFDDSGLCLPSDHSPEGCHNVTGSLMSNSHLSAYHYSTLQPQRQGSISSNGSMVNVSMQPAAINMVQTMPMQQYNSYPTTQQQQQQLYTHNLSASPPFMTTTYMPTNNYTTSAYTQQSNLPSLNRDYEAISVPRSSPGSGPALPPATALLSNGSRSHREPTTESY